MKKLYLTFTLSIFALAGFSQCSDFFISEYVEGWSNNKAIEIYNPTNQAKSLSGYGVQRYQNGSPTPGFTTNLFATVAAYDVYVVVIDKRDVNGTGNEAPVWDDLQAKADTFVTPDYNGGSEALYFNGNDAVVLIKGGQIIDIIGKAGEDPGNGWGAYTDGNGDPASWTKDHTLIRKATVTSGVTTNPVSFDPSLEYDSLPANTFDDLGIHVCDCQTSGLNEMNEQATLGIYPNPVVNDFFFVKAQTSIEKIELFDMLGKLVLTNKIESATTAVKVNSFELTKGVYLAKVKLANGGELVRKIAIN